MAQAPGPRTPASVQTLQYLARPEQFLTDCHTRYGDVFAIETVIFGREVCIVRPELIKQVFTGDPDQLRGGEANAALGPLVGDKSVLLLDGKEHLRQRRLLMPPFHGERMLAYRDAMREITARTIAGWRPGRTIDLHGEMQSITMDVILRTIFGAEDALAGPLRAKLTELLGHLTSPLTMLGTVPALRKDLFGLSPWARFQRSISGVNALIYEQIARRRAALATDAQPAADVLTMLLSARDEDGNPMSEVELRDELVTLLVAGHETTATELAWSFDLILRDRAVRTRLTTEIEVAAGDTDRMPYLDATIKEVLRLCPVIPAVGRMVKKPLSIGGFDIPEGTLVVPGVWLTHRLPDVYPEPLRFRPERFLDVKADPYSYLPFGGGIRRCIGLAFAQFEMKVVLSTILASVRLRPLDKDHARVTLRGFTHAPKGGVPVILD